MDNLLRLIKVFNVLPAGLYVEEAAQVSSCSSASATASLAGSNDWLCQNAHCQSVLQVAKRELAMECDYAYEARCQSRFKELVEADPDFNSVFHVPAVVPDLCTQRILTTELVQGVHIDKARLSPLLHLDLGVEEFIAQSQHSCLVGHWKTNTHAIIWYCYGRRWLTWPRA